MTVGEIFWVDLPPRGGHARAGRRPAIVAQTGAVSDALPTVILIPLTSQLDALRFPGTVLVQPDADNRLRQPSVALVFPIAAIDQRFLAARSGRVSPTVLCQFWKALDHLTGRQPA